MDGTEPPNKQSAQSAQWDDEEDSSEVCTLIGVYYHVYRVPRGWRRGVGGGESGDLDHIDYTHIPVSCCVARLTFTHAET